MSNYSCSAKAVAANMWKIIIITVAVAAVAEHEVCWRISSPGPATQQESLPMLTNADQLATLFGRPYTASAHSLFGPSCFIYIDYHSYFSLAVASIPDSPWWSWAKALRSFQAKSGMGPLLSNGRAAIPDRWEVHRRSGQVCSPRRRCTMTIWCSRLLTLRAWFVVVTAAGPFAAHTSLVTFTGILARRPAYRLEFFGSNNSCVECHDRRDSGRPFHRTRMSHSVNSVSFSPDGQHIVPGSKSGYGTIQFVCGMPYHSHLAIRVQYQQATARHLAFVQQFSRIREIYD